MSFSISMNSQDMVDFFDKWGINAQEAVRPAAQAAAEVIYESVKANVGQIKSVTGNLARSIYQVYSKTNSVENHTATYHISWNHITAPHGWMIENGHIQRYKNYQDELGRIRPMVRPGMKEKRQKPRRGASQATKDAYYVRLPKDIEVSGKFFLRRAADRFPAAAGAAKTVLVAYMMGHKE